MITGKEYLEAKKILDAYKEQLRVANIVGQSEQLFCECVGLGYSDCEEVNGEYICDKCGLPLED